MSKYIPVDKLLAEIERRIIEHRKSLKKDITLNSEAMLKGSLGAYESIEHFIDSLQHEHPEADLEEEIRDTCRGYRINDHHEQELGKQDIENIARYFYELGLNARKER